MKLLHFKRFDFFRRKVHMRFDEDYFRTYCGAFAGLALVLILLITFIIEVFNIYNGKLDNLSFVIKNKNQTMSWTESNLKHAVFGFSIKGNFLEEEGLLELNHGIKKGDFRTTVSPIYNCTETVYKNLNLNSKPLVPKDMEVYCFNTTADVMNSQYRPYFSLNMCQNSSSVNKGDKSAKKCKSQKIMNKILKRLEVWIFSLTDETDYTVNESLLKSSFIGKQVFASNTFSKYYKMYLREVEIMSTRGLLLRREEIFRTIQYFNQRSEIISVQREKEILLSYLKLDQTEKVTVSKHYKSVFKLMSKVGGLSHGLMIVMFMLVFPVREVLYYKKLINSMFNVCINPEDVKNAMGITTLVKGKGHEKGGKRGKSRSFYQKNIFLKKEKMGALASIFVERKRLASLPNIGIIDEGISIGQSEKDIGASRRKKNGKKFGTMVNLRGIDIKGKNDFRKLNQSKTLGRKELQTIKENDTQKHTSESPGSDLNKQENLRDKLQSGKIKKSEIVKIPKSAKKKNMSKNSLSYIGSGIEIEPSREVSKKVETINDTIKNNPKTNISELKSSFTPPKATENKNFKQDDESLNHQRYPQESGGGRGGNSSSILSHKSPLPTERKELINQEEESIENNSSCIQEKIAMSEKKKTIFQKFARYGAEAFNQLNPLNFFGKKQDEEIGPGNELEGKIDQIKENNARIKNMEEKLKLKIRLSDFITFWLRDSVYSSYKTRLYKRGKHMIQQKIDIQYVIQSLLELEKLKTLLFDSDQYSLFEHIPKPLLFERKMIDGDQKEIAGNEKFLMSHNSTFWNKKNKILREKDFVEALHRIRNKENPDVIDERLIKLIDDFNS